MTLKINIFSIENMALSQMHIMMLPTSNQVLCNV